VPQEESAPEPATEPAVADTAVAEQPSGRTRRSYRQALTKPNIAAGIAVGAYLIPQSMAYGELAGVGPAIGLSMSLIPLALYPLLGSSRWLSLGPESATALMAAATAAPIIVHYPGRELQVMATLTLLTGVIMLLARLIRAGAIADLLSRPVLVGYMAGVAVLIITSQLSKIVTGDIDADTIGTLIATIGDTHIDRSAAIVAGLTIATLWITSRISRSLPGAVIALGVAIIAGNILDVTTIGAIASVIPSSAIIPDIALVPELAVAALAVTIVAYSDSILTARAMSAPGERVNANQELVAMGSINLLNSVTGAYPVSGSSTRTALARSTGATNKYYSWTALAVLIVLPAAAAGLISQIPTAGLAGLVMYAGIRLIDIEGIRKLATFRVRELGLAIATTIGVLTLGILPGIGVAIALSIAELLARLMRPHEGILGFVPGLAGMHDIDDHPDAQQEPGLLVFRYDAPLFFANGPDFYNQTIAAVEAHPDTKWFILNMEANVEVDSTGLDNLELVHDELKRRGIHLALARVKNDLAAPLAKYGTLDRIGRENVYPTLPTAVDAYRAAMRRPDPTTSEPDAGEPHPNGA
jgi:high affinity sulfate transporter 1